jgi:uncharacterized SAM-binding protein YcdF (DUF218 family)
LYLDVSLLAFQLFSMSVLKNRWLRWFGGLLASLVVLLAAGYAFRAPVLRGAARAWIVNEPLTKADVIVVLGGGPETRPFEAARLFHLGLAPKILLMNPRPSPPTQLALIPAEADLDRSILLNQHIPAEDILVSADIVTNSYDESIAVRNWARTNRVTRVIIPTDIFHTRRIRWLYGKELKGTGIHVEIEALPVRQYTAEDWWRHEEGVTAFQNEILKYAYYRLKY